MIDTMELVGFVDDETEEPIQVPAKYEVCGTCNGHGTSSAYLGAFTREDFDEDPDFMRDYMNGAYDRICDECNGKRVVQVVDEERLSPELRKKLHEYWQDMANLRQMERMERMMGA